jgi:prepilin-type processing-associated H-X9-DG protein
MRHSQGALFVIPLTPRKLILPSVLIAGLAALLLCQRPSTAYAPIPADPPVELRLVFPDAFAFQRINVAALTDRELFKTVLGTVTRISGKSEKDIFVREFGAPLIDLEAIASIANDKNNVNIVTTRKPIETKKVLAVLAPRATEQTYKGKVFHVGESRMWREEAVPFPRDRDFPRDKDKRGGLDKDFGGFKDKPADKPLPPPDDIRKDDPPPKDLAKPTDVRKDREDRKEGDGPQDKDAPFRDKDFFPGRDGPMRLDPYAQAVYFLSDRTYVTGFARDVMAFIDTAVKPDEKHPLHEALGSAGKHHFAAAVVPTEEMAREMRWGMRQEMRRGFFAEMTYQNMKPMLALKKAAIMADIGEDSRLETSFTFPDARSAERAQDSARFFLQMVRGSVNYFESEISKTLGGEDRLTGTKLAGMVDRLKAACADATVKVDETTLRVGVKVKTDADSVKAVMDELAPRLEQAARRTTSSNNLKQLALAMHMYDHTMGFLPAPATQIDRQGKPSGLSWRVHLLPYMEQLPLYNQFKLDEPWDSDNNKKLIPLMPKVFEAPGKKTKEAGMTFYQAFTTLPDENLRSAFPLIQNARMRIVAILDGTSYTFAFVEAAEPVIWTKPDDILVDYKQKILPKLGGVFDEGFNVAMCDGSVRFLRKKDVTEEFLKAAITSNGGEVINWPGEDREEEDRPRRYYKDKGDFNETRPTFPAKDIAKDFRPRDEPKDKDGPKEKFERPVDKLRDK